MFREIIAERAVQTPDLEQINASSPPSPFPDTPHALIWRRGVLTFNIKGVQQFILTVYPKMNESRKSEHSRPTLCKY